MKPDITIIGESGSVGSCVKRMLDSQTKFNIDAIPSPRNRDAVEKSLNNTDLAILCVPDEIAKIIMDVHFRVASASKVIDCSTAFRTEWVYGLPEVIGEQTIAGSAKVTNPGCHATAAILGIQPLMAEGIISADTPISISSLTGYSGGGNKMIKDYENSPKPPLHYSANKAHKHIPEIQKITGAKNLHFQPTVINEERGILSTITVPTGEDISPKLIFSVFRDYFKNSLYVQVKEFPEDGKISMGENNHTNNTTIYPTVQNRFIKIIAVLDNLGKGSAGAAIQNAELMLG